MEEFNIDNFLRVSVLQSGKVLADGTEIGLDELKARLSSEKCQRWGIFLYFEEGCAASMLSPFPKDFLKVLLDSRVALSISHRPDFLDTVWEHTHHPRVDNFLKVSVLPSGKLLADGAEIRLAELEARLLTLDREKWGLWLCGPPPLADEVLRRFHKLVLKDIPPLFVRVSEEPGLSDAIAE